jgi:citrate synthase
MNSTEKMRNSTAKWDKQRNKIQTDIGKWVGGEQVYIHDKKLFGELFNRISYMQMLVLNVTGKLISAELGRWLENNFLCMSYPDARIWCNQVGAFSGETGTSPSAATVAGVLAADSRAYGGSQTTFLAMSYLKKAQEQIRAGKTIEALVCAAPIKHGKPAIIGFARPVAKNDERIEPHIKMTRELGFDIGPYMQLAMSIAAYMEEEFSTGINIGGYTSAFLLDQGFTPEQGYQIKSLCVASGVTACYLDYYQKKERSFLPLRCSDVEYAGPEPRRL